MSLVNVNFTLGQRLSKCDAPDRKFVELFHPNESTAWYFTDGSKSPNLIFAGFAVVSVDDVQV